MVRGAWMGGVLLAGLAGCGWPDLGGGEACAELVAPTTEHFAGRTSTWSLACAGEPARSGTYTVGAARFTEEMPCQGGDDSVCVPCDPAWGASCSHSLPGVVAPLATVTGDGLVGGGFRQLCGGMGGGEVSLVLERAGGARVRCGVALLDGDGMCFSLSQAHTLDGRVAECTLTTGSARPPGPAGSGGPG